MDYFFRCQKSNFSFENNKHMFRKFFWLTVTSLDLLTPRLFLELYMSLGYIQNVERYLKNSICIRFNNFVKSPRRHRTYIERA